MKKKRVFTLGLALLIIFSLAACGSSGRWYTYKGVSLELPEGFTVHDDDPALAPVAYGPDFPTARDNILFSSSSPESIDDYSAENVKDKLYPEILGLKNVKIVDFVKTTINKRDAVECFATLTSIDGVDMRQMITLVFFPDRTVSVGFTIVNIEDYQDAFYESMASISAR